MLTLSLTNWSFQLVCRRAKNHFDPNNSSFSDNGDDRTDTSDHERIFQRCVEDFMSVNATQIGQMYFV